MNIPIIPKEITKLCTSIAIDVPHIVLNNKCFIRVIFYDNDQNVILTDNFELIEDYHLWQRDDDLIDYICNKYNLTKVDVQQI